MKIKTVFSCTNCGGQTPKWQGKCPGCGEWNTLVEEVAGGNVSAKHSSLQSNILSVPKKLKEIELTDDNRFSSGIGEFDRVLGGGIVAGSLVLIGGDPGIGKSTLLLQMCKTIKTDSTIFYASGEESQKQIKIRAGRLKLDNDNLVLISENNLDVIMQAAERFNPQVLIIDSVQTIYRPEVPSTSGSVTQVREVTMKLMKYAKETGTVVFLVGHVTKDGAIAGPKVLEHMVDCVLYFEGESHQFHRILRAAKNRFGSTNEIGVFEMRDTGLSEVLNPSEMLLAGRPENTSGSCVVCTMEGSRPILAEIQALVSPTHFNMPRRQATGVDYNRVSMLMAVLEKRLGMNLAGEDAYVNVIGGLKIDEPAIDLGLVLAIGSSFRNMPIDKNLIAIGEVGLTGELRSVNFIDKRINEAAKLGFSTCIIPKGNAAGLKLDKNIKIVEVRNLRDALAAI